MNMDERTNSYPPAVTVRPEPETGSEAMSLIGLPRGQKRQVYKLDHWRVVDEYTAVGFCLVEGVPVPVGLVHYAPITAVGIRDLKIGRMVKPDPWMPRFDTEEPPDPDQMRAVWWKATGKVRTVVVGPHTVPDVLVRGRRGADPTEFYTEVARLYRAFQATTNSPTAHVASAAGVTRNTAAQWVHQARKRGLLEPADKGK